MLLRRKWFDVCRRDTIYSLIIIIITLFHKIQLSLNKQKQNFFDVGKVLMYYPNS